MEPVKNPEHLAEAVFKTCTEIQTELSKNKSFDLKKANELKLKLEVIWTAIEKTELSQRPSIQQKLFQTIDQFELYYGNHTMPQEIYNIYSALFQLGNSPAPIPATTPKSHLAPLKPRREKKKKLSTGTKAPPTPPEPLSSTSSDTSAIRASSPLVRTPDIMSDLNRVAEKIEIYHKRVDEIPDASFRHGSSASILRATVTEAHKFADSQFTSLTELRENPSIGKEERSLIDRLLKSITELLAKLQKKFS